MNEVMSAPEAAAKLASVGKEPVLHKEELTFDEVHPTQRSYK